MAIKYGFSLSLLVIQIVLSLLFSSYHFAKTNNELSSLVTPTCNHTECPDVCISTLESDPRSSTAGLTNLSRIALEIAVTKANETKADAFKLFNNATSDESRETRLACYEYGFNSSVYQFEGSLQYFDEQNYTESSRIVDIFNGGLDYCIDVGVVELTASITFLKKFTTVVKQILDLLFY